MTAPTPADRKRVDEHRQSMLPRADYKPSQNEFIRVGAPLFYAWAIEESFFKGLVEGRAETIEACASIAADFMLQTEIETRWHRKRNTAEWQVHCCARDITAFIRALAPPTSPAPGADERTKCFRCDGKGWRLVETTYHGERNQLSKETCSACEGTGRPAPSERAPNIEPPDPLDEEFAVPGRRLIPQGNGGFTVDISTPGDSEKE